MNLFNSVNYKEELLTVKELINQVESNYDYQLETWADKGMYDKVSTDTFLSYGDYIAAEGELIFKMTEVMNDFKVNEESWRKLRGLMTTLIVKQGETISSFRLANGKGLISNKDLEEVESSREYYLSHSQELFIKLNNITKTYMKFELE